MPIYEYRIPTTELRLTFYVLRFTNYALRSFVFSILFLLFLLRVLGVRRGEKCLTLPPPSSVPPSAAAPSPGRVPAVKSRPMYTSHSRIDGYHQKECGGG